VRRFSLLFFTLFFFLGMIGCPKKAPPPQATPLTQAQEPVTTPTPRETISKEQTGTGALGEGATIASLERIYFDFDDYSIRPDQRGKVQKAAEWLRGNPSVRIRLEGHADERGPEDYNMALGLKRARSVKDLLVTLGVSPDRIELRSYGEEMPLEPGHNEGAWAKNRRVEFVVLQ
jgi:peptidoglycan-associated lipoprotein